MTSFVALLRAVNVGGVTIKMDDLKRIAVEAGLAKVRTYIASGNLLFESSLSETEVKALLEQALRRHVGKPVGVLVRTAREMAAVLAANPFPAAAGNRSVAIFLDEAPAKGALHDLAGRKDEEAALGEREIYVHYPSGQGRSKLKIAAAGHGTARNMNTVARLAAMAAEA